MLVKKTFTKYQHIVDICIEPLNITEDLTHFGMKYVTGSTQSHWGPIILLLIDRPPCNDGMRIVGRWCSTPCTEATETLEYVP